MNWLDADEVRAERELWNTTFPLEGGRLDAWIEAAGGCVLDAIAALDEPDDRCYNDYCNCTDPEFKCEAQLLHRIWRIARIVCGKEEGREG